MKTAIVTGAAKRIGRQIAITLHQQGYQLLLHYARSSQEANTLAETLNQQRPNSVTLVQADLTNTSQIQHFVDCAYAQFAALDLLVNNASSFYPTDTLQPLNALDAQWENLFGTNVKAPFLLSCALRALLQKSQRTPSIVNLVDIHAQTPLTDHSIYCMAKASTAMLTKTMANELAPDIRVNGISPGVILWPEQGVDKQLQQETVENIPLKRKGDASNIADTVLFLAESANYITGQIIAVDGGRSITSTNGV